MAIQQTNGCDAKARRKPRTQLCCVALARARRRTWSLVISSERVSEGNSLWEEVPWGRAQRGSSQFTNRSSSSHGVILTNGTQFSQPVVLKFCNLGLTLIFGSRHGIHGYTITRAKLRRPLVERLDFLFLPNCVHRHLASVLTAHLLLPKKRRWEAILQLGRSFSF